MKIMKELDEIRDTALLLCLEIKTMQKRKEITESNVDNIEEIGRRILDNVAILRIQALFDEE